MALYIIRDTITYERYRSTDALDDDTALEHVADGEGHDVQINQIDNSPYEIVYRSDD